MIDCRSFAGEAMDIHQPNDRSGIPIEAWRSLPVDRDDVSGDGDRWPIRYCALFIITASTMLWIGIVVLGTSLYAAL